LRHPVILRAALSRATLSQDERPSEPAIHSNLHHTDGGLAFDACARCRQSASTQTHRISGLTSQLPLARTPPQGPLRRFLGQFMEHDMPGRTQGALAAHLAVEQKALDDLLQRRDRFFQPLVADLAFHTGCSATNDPLKRVVKLLQTTGVAHRPATNGVHQACSWRSIGAATRMLLAMERVSLACRGRGSSAADPRRE